MFIKKLFVITLVFINYTLTYAQDDKSEKSGIKLGREIYSLEERIIEKVKNQDANKYGRRTLYVVNSTGTSINVFVAYRTKFSDNTWGWVNENFKDSWTFNNGETSYLLDGETNSGKPWRINADFVLIWAEAVDKKYYWIKHKYQMLKIGSGSENNAVTDSYTFTFY